MFSHKISRKILLCLSVSLCASGSVSGAVAGEYSPSSMFEGSAPSAKFSDPGSDYRPSANDIEAAFRAIPKKIRSLITLKDIYNIENYPFMDKQSSQSFRERIKSLIQDADNSPKTSSGLSSDLTEYLRENIPRWSMEWGVKIDALKVFDNLVKYGTFGGPDNSSEDEGGGSGLSREQVDQMLKNSKKLLVLKKISKQDSSLDVSMKDLDNFLDRYGRDRILALPPEEIAYMYRVSIDKAEMGGAYVDQYGMPHNGSITVRGVIITIPPLAARQKQSALGATMGRAPDSSFPGNSTVASSLSGNSQSQEDWFFTATTASWDQWYVHQLSDDE